MPRTRAQREAAEKNLKKGKKTQYQSGEEAAKNGRKGGIASGEAKRQKKTLSELAQVLADAPVTNEKQLRMLQDLGFEGEDLNHDAVAVGGLFNAIGKGNVAAFEKWEELKEKAEPEANDTARERSLAVMRANFWENVSSGFGAFAVCAIKHRYRHYEVSGGRGSMKSSTVSLLVVRLVMEHPDVHALVLRKVGNTIADSVFTQYQWAIAQLGVGDWWKARTSPPTLTYKPTGQRILFRGADDPLKLKSIKAPFGYIGITHFEEKDQFSGRAEIDSILQSTMRGGQEFWNFESFNPPLSRDNWANLDSGTDRDDRLRHKSSYLDADNPEWLGKAFLEEAEALKERDERRYRHEYLGEAVGTGGNVFENLVLREITDEEIRRFDRIYQGVDWGWFPDPYAFIRLHYDPARETVYLLDERYETKVSNEETAKWILQKGYNGAYTICDSAEPKSVADYRAYGVNAREAVKGPGSVEYGIKWLQKRKIVIDRNRTPNAYREFLNYEYEKNREGQWVSGYPDADNHLIDAVRYALERVYRKYGSGA